MARLTAKRKRFGDEYLIDLNATQAAIRAGYSPKTAGSISTDLLKDPVLQLYIQNRMSQREYRTEITQDRVLQELAKIGFADIKEFLSFRTEKAVVAYKEGDPVFGYQDVIELRPSDQIDGTMISEVKHTREGLAFKLHDKVAALDKIGRHLGMFNDKLKIEGEIKVKKLEDML
ncbi:MAG: terminase small subunit [Candidatus Pristimantibacillus sp.]